VNTIACNQLGVASVHSVDLLGNRPNGRRLHADAVIACMKSRGYRCIDMLPPQLWSGANPSGCLPSMATMISELART
jgi:hypothetical protein